jgi:hypothetical protein
MGSRSMTQGLREIEKLESWGELERAEAAASAFLTRHPDHAGELEEARERGRASRSLLSELEAACKKHGAHSPEAQETAEAIRARFPYLAHRAEKKLGYYGAARQRQEEGRRRQLAGEPLSRVRPGIEHAIGALPCQPSWTLLVDETGASFTQDGAQRGRKGRFVGLLLPPEPGLSELRQFHAADAPLDEVDDAVQCVLDAPVGVFGTTVVNLPPRPGDRWASGVLALVAWVARLLPLAGADSKARVRLRVLVEQRGAFGRGTRWEAPRDQLLDELARVDAARAKRLDVKLELVAKDGHPCMGYVDALAFTWGSPTPASKERLRRSGLQHHCLLESDGPRLRAAWDHLKLYDHIDPQEWRWLLGLSDSAAQGSIPSVLLARAALPCSKGTDRWQRYSDCMQKHMESKAVDLRQLGREVQWLQAAAPGREQLPATARVAFLTAELAEASHRGQIALPVIESELDELSERLLEEDARLICQADLYRAVLETNRFAFDRASEILARWETLPRAVPGLQLWGRVRSSLGQHAAFRGDHAEAVHLFEQALQAFERLSDQRSAGLDITQTSTYLALVYLDQPDSLEADLLAAVKRVTGSLDEAVERLSRSDEPCDKYAHHLLLRTLLQRGKQGWSQAYLEQRRSWRSGYGHPWQLIELYRALLLQDTDHRGAGEHLATAISLAMSPEHGATMKLIGVTLATIAHGWGVEWPHAEHMLDAVQASLPKAGERIDVLRSSLRVPMEPLVLLKETLPFNFR